MGWRMHQDAILIPRKAFQFLLIYFGVILGTMYFFLLLCAAYMTPRIEPSYPVYINSSTSGVFKIFLFVAFAGLLGFVYGLVRLSRSMSQSGRQEKWFMLSIPISLLFFSLTSFPSLVRFFVAIGNCF